MYKLIRPWLFALLRDAEFAHARAIRLLGFLGSHKASRWAITRAAEFSSPVLRQTLWGLDFKNPVGLAAGFDKHAEALGGLENLGFGFLEIGTVTRHGQAGNPRPRMFRLAQDEALVNRIGFNNRGADHFRQKLQTVRTGVPLGANIGKSKITELDQSLEDYLYSFTTLFPFADYFVVNVSSPNTPGLRSLQNKDELTNLLRGLMVRRAELVRRGKVKKPVLLKIAPDLALEAIDEVVQVCREVLADGIIATNTTIARDGLAADPNEAGGLSGRPLRKQSTEIIRRIYKTAPDLPIVGVGGIFSAEDAYDKIKAGASLVQVYTGLIYEGPLLVKRINQGLARLLERDGFSHINQAVGKAA